VLLTVCLFLLSQGSQISTNWWISHWSDVAASTAPHEIQSLNRSYMTW